MREYIRIEDIQAITEKAQEGAKNGFVSVDKIGRMLKDAKKIKITGVNNLPDIIKNLEMALSEPKERVGVNKRQLSRCLKADLRRMTKLTAPSVDKLLNSMRLIGLDPFNSDRFYCSEYIFDINIGEVLDYLRWLHQEKDEINGKK